MRSNPQRVAWAALLSALAVFCALCISSAALLRWFILESPTQLSVVVHVGRGTVGLAESDSADEKAVRTSATVENKNRLNTDSLSQGYVSFSDPYSNTIIATVMLYNHSVLTLYTANRPRFSFSENPYQIRLIGATGRFEVWVNAALGRDLLLEIESPLGLTQIREGGSYQIDSNAGYLNVTALTGGAILVGLDGRQQRVAALTKATVHQNNPAISLVAAPVDLLPNSSFGQSEDWPVEWKCYRYADIPEESGGHYEFTTEDGRPVIHISRLDENLNHGETGCVQTWPGEGLDVQSYASLRLRVTMQIKYQKLSACGDQGSECPVMLRLAYTDQNGNENRGWIHGFFADFTPGLGRRTCDTCLGDHDQINKEAWYTFESINFITDLPLALGRPAYINEIKFYASGHQYEILLAEVSLLAETSVPEAVVLPRE